MPAAELDGFATSSNAPSVCACHFVVSLNAKPGLGKNFVKFVEKSLVPCCEPAGFANRSNDEMSLIGNGACIQKDAKNPATDNLKSK